MKKKPTFPPHTPGIPRISHSSMEKYLRCGHRYFLEKQQTVRHTTVALARGSAVDAAVSSDNYQKIHKLKKLNLRQIKDAAVFAYEEEFSMCATDEAKLDIQAGVDSTACAAEIWALEGSPRTQPRSSQFPLVARVGEYELAGVPDYFVHRGPVDLKVGREWSPDAVRWSRQLTGYGILFRAYDGDWPQAVGIDTIFHKYGRWHFKRIWSPRTVGDYAAHVDAMKAAIAGIEAGVDVPAPEGAWWCSRRWCPHFRDCKYVGPTRLKYEK